MQLLSLIYNYLQPPSSDIAVFVELVFFVIALLVVFVGSVSDLMTREVPDLLNYGLIIAGFGLRIMLALLLWDASIIVVGVFGFLLALIIGFGMFYAGQWGGGDTKMILGVGVLFGFYLDWNSLFVAFLLNSLWVGAVYGLLFSIHLGLANIAPVLKRSIENVMRFRYAIILLVIAAISFWIITESILHDTVLSFLAASLPSFGIVLVFLVAYVRAVESVCMIKSIPVGDLTEGDWIFEDVRVKGKYITGPKELGVSLDQIATLKKLKTRGLISHVTIKIGIPFVPSFLFSLVISYGMGNLLSFLF